MSLVRRDPANDNLEALQTRLAGLQADLDARVADLTRLRGELGTFRIRYSRDVGHLHEEVDDLHAALDEAECDIRAANRGEERGPVNGHAAPAEAVDLTPPDESASRYTSDAVRKLFREVAKMIHPDLSHDAGARDQRHALMAEANRAYAMGDADHLRRILEAWEGRPDAVQGDGLEATRERLARRIAQLDAQLAACNHEVAALEDTPLWQLKVMVDEALANGKDLMADMIRRLERDILAARNRLDAMRWQPVNDERAK